MKKVLVVFNKKSGKNKSDHCKKKVYIRLKELDINFKFIYLNTLSKISDMDKYDTIVAVGGDGTVLSVLPYIVNTPKKLGIIPCGTANLFAASLSIPEDTDKAIDTILLEKTSKIDIGKAGEQYFSLRVGFGYDACIINNAKSNFKNKIGYFEYLFQGIINAFRLSKKTYKVNIDNEEMTVDATSIIVANAGNIFKNIFTIAPKGSLVDGKFDIFILKVKNILDFIEIFFQIILGLHKQNSKVIYTQASNISILTSDINSHIDGEMLLNKNILNIQVLPKAINVLTP
ncbi:MAG: diacylglycerol kinase family protein [Candidatus Gastranaerophilaceae bacterium]|jgi:YegS/Rv2252/BmrU family lipid kinase